MGRQAKAVGMKLEGLNHRADKLSIPFAGLTSREIVKPTRRTSKNPSTLDQSGSSSDASRVPSSVKSIS